MDRTLRKIENRAQTVAGREDPSICLTKDLIGR